MYKNHLLTQPKPVCTAKQYSIITSDPCCSVKNSYKIIIEDADFFRVNRVVNSLYKFGYRIIWCGSGKRYWLFGKQTFKVVMWRYYEKLSITYHWLDVCVDDEHWEEAAELRDFINETLELIETTKP